MSQEKIFVFLVRKILIAITYSKFLPEFVVREVVLSVDGLDVIDGKAGSIRKKGYVIAPGKTLEVKGFRTSTSAVAAFKFSSVGASYANFSGGDTRNVGIIGMAVFQDKVSWQEARQRGGASPFAEAPSNQIRQ